MKHRRPTAVALAVVVASGVAAAAAFAAGNAATSSRASSNTLVAAISGEPQGFDPQKTSAYASFQVLENVYDTLVEPGPNLTMQPALATGWKVSKNHLTWTFAIRKGVRFQNGRGLTSADIVYSLQRMRDKKSGVSYRFDAVKSVSAAGKYSVVIRLNRPAPNLLTSIGGYKGLAIVPKEIVANNTIGTHPVGTGPFEFVSYKPGDEVVLKKNPYYWRKGLPHLDGVTFKIIPDNAVAVTNLKGGQVDWIDTVPPQSRESLQKTQGVVVASTASDDYWYWAPNEKRKPFDDVRVRQALAYGIDIKQVTAAARNGAATPNETAIPKGNAWYHAYSPFTYNPTKAKQLLQEAGVSNLSLDLLVTSQYPESVAAGQVIASELANIGVTVKVDTVDFGTWLAREGKGDCDAFLLSWLGNIDPDDFYYAQHHTGAKFNFQGFSNKQVDAYLDQGRQAIDQKVRKRAYDRAAELIVKNASYIYLYNPNVVQAWSSKVKGYQPRSDSAIRFRDARLAK